MEGCSFCKGAEIRHNYLSPIVKARQQMDPAEERSKQYCWKEMERGEGGAGENEGGSGENEGGEGGAGENEGGEGGAGEIFEMLQCSAGLH